MSKRIVLFLFFLILSAATGTHLQGAVINVTTTEDNVPGSLRAALITAHTNSEADTVNLPAGTYVLTGAPGEDENFSGDLDINTDHEIAIIGSGAGNTIISGNGVDRVFHIFNGTLSVSRVTIQGGLTEGEAHGGGICNKSTLTLTKCIIRNNHAGDGFRWNGFNAGNGGRGGGIYNQGILTLTDCTIQNNRSGEGKWSSMDRAGNGGHGGGIYNVGLATLTGCTASNNQAGNGGGTSSAGYPGGDGGSGGGIYNGGTLTLTNCTVYKNNTGYGDEADGGGKGAGGDGGGICNTAGAVTTLEHCTVTANTAKYYQWVTYAGYGGGVFNDPAGTINTENTIISDNIVEEGGTGPDCYGTFNSLGYNLIRDVSTCTVVGDTTGNITGVDPMLGALADNGGPTRTCALEPGSPAIDAGYSSGISRDQRKYTRPRDFPGIPNASDGADIGAFELSSQFTVSGTITADGFPLAGVTLTFGDGGDATTDENGDYAYPVPSGWSGTVTPFKEDYTFSPAAREYTGVTADQTGQDYTANAYIVSISILNPSDGDTVSGTVVISASASSSTGRSSVQSISGVKFYIDGTHKRTDTTEPYGYTWDTTRYANGTHRIKVSASNTAGMTQEAEITVTVENLTHMSLSRDKLNFGADTAGFKTRNQSFMIGGSGGVPLDWTITGDAEWLECTPGSGTGPGVVTVSIDPSELAVGTHTATVTAAASNADNSPQTLTVYLAVYSAGTTMPPFGSFDTPLHNSTVRSSVPVTGWVVDDIEAVSIDIYREPLSTESTGLIYIGGAVPVEGARPDIETDYPSYPLNYQAGWGYMLLTNYLPNRGNGTFTLHALAADKEGNTVTLGTKTILCDNENAVEPFGAIDTPAQGGTISGGDYINFGWALTPLPNTIPIDGSTITVWVDGVSLGHPVYNQYREDIATLFPGYNNSDGAVGYFSLDTAVYQNGVHTIAWIVEDDAGNADGIGSRYFTVENSMVNGQWSTVNGQRTEDMPVDYVKPVKVGKGYGKDMEIREMYPDENGIVTVEINELERVVLRFTPGASLRALTPLPIGSTFAPNRGFFAWQPGPGFLGRYAFIFTEQTGTHEIMQKHIIIDITPVSGKR